MKLRSVVNFVLIAIIIISGCTINSPPSPTPTHNSAKIEVPPTRSHWEKVQTIAKDWEENAFVNEVRIYLPYADETYKAVRFNYFVQSPAREFAYLKVYCDKYHCTSDEIEKSSGVFLCEPISCDDFKVDSDQVFHMVLGLDKRELVFKELISTQFELTRQYEGSCQEDQVVWIVQHMDIKELSIHIMVIDALTGKIIKHYNE